jgi:hypothetical protein
MTLFYGKEKCFLLFTGNKCWGSGSGWDPDSMGSLGPDPDPRGNKRPPHHKNIKIYNLKKLKLYFFLKFSVIKTLDPDPDKREMLNLDLYPDPDSK